MLGLIKKVQSFFGSDEPREVALSHDEEIKDLVSHVINENFGVHIEPIIFPNATFSLRLVRNEAIEQIPEEYRGTFVYVVDMFSKAVYVKFGIEDLLRTFYGKPYTCEMMMELKGIIESYIVMHESIVNKKMTVALTESFMIAVNEKYMV